ncbi:hypothetical protein [Nonomuraea endophytica]|uniref:Uncharacterized protein n=1 Tax=Nonomuraea endophytica TaxID=714136 RepID=A0A7W8A4G0_9ACTN|nr:hypothetical protein [Nonomuraea endophytica]MBB5079348.1 hypothetical protein [Nonomuraea endophytica]
MSERTPPAPVIGAVVAVGVVAALLLGTGALLIAGGLPRSAVLPVAFGLLGAAIARGLWPGWRGPRVLAAFFGAFVIMYAGTALADGLADGPGGTGAPAAVLIGTFVLALAGAAVIVLLFVPPSSRAWFARYRKPRPRRNE